MPHCVVCGCTPKVRAAAQANGQKISYYKFPEDKALRKAWIMQIKREHFNVSRYSTVCTLHFTKDSYKRSPDLRNSIGVMLKAELLPDVVPTKFLYRKAEKPIDKSKAQKKRVHSEVGEIFTATGVAFKELGELTRQLHSVNEPLPASGKWTPVEIEMLRNALLQFCDNLDTVSNQVKNRMEIEMSAELNNIGQNSGNHKYAESQLNMKDSDVKQNSEMTLNKLNVPDSEIDVEGIGADQKIKLEYDSSAVESS